MRYFGGKARLAKELASVINSFKARSYHEPFCGMYSVGSLVTAPRRTASDVHPDLIMLFNAVQEGWIGPEFVTEEEYARLKVSEPSAMRGYVGFGSSYGGKFFGGYARDPKSDRNYTAECRAGWLKLLPYIEDVRFTCQSYKDYDGDAELIYCDPPYVGTTGFTAGKFDGDEFWRWVRDKSRYATVLVSEYTAPKWATEIWQKKVKTDMNARDGGKLSRVEKLFCVTPVAAPPLPLCQSYPQIQAVPVG
jgi:DNA adenine methylase